jgi:hypothetical protein
MRSGRLRSFISAELLKTGLERQEFIIVLKGSNRFGYAEYD